jgi:hypothetical protein
MMFAPVLLFSSYLNLSGYKTDAAGTTAAWSGLYALLALRRRQVSSLCDFMKDCGLVVQKEQLLICLAAKQFKQKFTVRGVVRGASLGLCAVNVAGCGLAYVFGRREKEE